MLTVIMKTTIISISIVINHLLLIWLQLGNAFDI